VNDKYVLVRPMIYQLEDINIQTVGLVVISAGLISVVGESLLVNYLKEYVMMIVFAHVMVRKNEFVD